MDAKVIAIVNQKGGTGKTTTTLNLGVGLAKSGKNVLLVDTDPQGSLTISLGYPQPDKLSYTLSDVYADIMEDAAVAYEKILTQKEGVDLMPANITLAGIEVTLVNSMNREKILKQFIIAVRNKYDYILLDCMPSLGMLTINALTCADSVLIPVGANYLSAKGLEQLLMTIAKVNKHLNPYLEIEGILLTMVDGRTNYAKEISTLIRETYGKSIKVFDVEIPRSVRACETSAEGISIYMHDPKGKVANAYQMLTTEVRQHDEKK